MKTKTLFQLAGAFLVASSLLLSCSSEVKKTAKTDSAVTTAKVKTDTLPPLDTDSNTHTKPETMQSGSATKTKN